MSCTRSAMLRGLGTAFLGLALAGPAAAQNVVVDANIFWDNDGGNYAGDTGGAACAHGLISNTQLATQIFDNRSVNPGLVDPYNLNSPDWSPAAGSAALNGHPGFRAVDIDGVDAWFTPTCFVGASDQDDRWWEGWTYYNYADGAGRTDIPAGAPIDVVANIAANTVWTTGNKYRLNGRIGVLAGVTLTIQPGTVILGSGVGSYLVIERDGNIDAQGTAGQPIIFTSGAAPGSQFPGDWGGVVIHGKAVANCAGITGCGLTSVVGDCESEGGAGFFGGSDDADNSGIVKYARVEYAGQEISPNNELNAWTMNAVGTGTQLSYMQAHLGTDDLFEWFGGTARMKYLVATGGDDDNLDWQMGYRGKVQFAVCQQAGNVITPNADAGIEADNNEFNEQCAGRSNPTLANLTLIGSGNLPGGARGIRLRRGTAGTVVNSIVQGWSDVGLRVETSALNNCAGAVIAAQNCPTKCDSILVDANCFWDNDGGDFAGDVGGAACWHGAITNGQLATTVFDNDQSNPALTDPYNLNAPDWSPQSGSPVIGGRVVEIWGEDSWFTPVCYKGGAGWDDRWWEGWTYYNYADGAGRTDIPGGAPIDVVANIAVNTTWTTGNKYRLNGRIGVQPGVTLTIQPGTVILGSGVGSYLVIERDANINAQGTAAQPIIFTSGAAPGSQFPGDWGGVVIHGNAVANCAGITGCGLTSVVGDCESEGGAGFFGGDDDDDDSGVVRYARVEYAGQEISPNNELNAWTMNAVGASTVLEYMQAHLGTDDLFEWFGGTARMKYLVATGGDDDNLDWQMGYRGRVQFAVCQQAGNVITPNADAGIEADNNEFDEQCAGRSCPMLSNLTLIGSGNLPGGARGIRLRRGTAGVIVNSVIQGWSNVGLRVETSAMNNCAAQVAIPDADCGLLAVGDDPVDAGSRLTTFAAPNPTRGAANIRFALDRDSNVQVKVFDVNGRLVDTVLEGRLGAGDQAVQWKGTDHAGLYFYEVVTDTGRYTGKIVVAR